jgi:hypothetical protein
MRELAKKVRIGSLLRLAALATAATSLGGCATLYDDYYGDSYYDDYAYSDYSCDPYNQFDYYYDCDNRSGFFNIGFGGGWYNNFFYPGYGFYLFDRGGRRFDMDNYYRRYWGGQRHEYWRQYRGNHQNAKSAGPNKMAGAFRTAKTGGATAITAMAGDMAMASAMVMANKTANMAAITAAITAMLMAEVMAGAVATKRSSLRQL